MAAQSHYSPDSCSSKYLASSGPSASSGAFITNSRNFTVAGGHFTNVIHCAPTTPSDFRTIPLGDLDLRNEIRVDECRIASRHHGICAARRIYTARVEGKQSAVTAAIYEGEHAEESFAKTWRHELSKYSGFRVEGIACVANLTTSNGAWEWSLEPWRFTDMENGWRRLHSSHVEGVIWATFDAPESCWLSQANHVFSQLEILPKHEDWFLVYSIVYWLTFSGPLENIPTGYLFLCPSEDLRSNDGAWLATTECPAYWSLDSAGGSRLCPEDATRLGFPSFALTSEARVSSWDEDAYVALSRFHSGKGFDPNSQDIARHLGYPIFELSCSPNVGSVHIEEVSSDSLEAQPDPVLASCDALHTQRFRLMIGGVLGLIMALVVIWSYRK
ncbi:hypothetical protein C8R44DRAFT_886878 [Mycena epipterygia]|nr:hypothetical protein C8R44DRAFT_886878 [Mycena epipterygia]